MTIDELLRLPSIDIKEVETIPSVAATYAVVAGNEVLYIGKAKNLKNRWSSHHRIAKLRTYANARVFWLEGSLYDIPDFELDWIIAFSPKFNTRIPSRSPNWREILDTIGPDFNMDIEQIYGKSPEVVLSRIDDYLYNLVQTSPEIGLDLFERLAVIYGNLPAELLPPRL